MSELVSYTLYTPSFYWWRWSNRGNWSILVPRGKEINWDFPSRGDRKGKSPNWILREMWCFGMIIWNPRTQMKWSEKFWHRGWYPLKRNEKSPIQSRVVVLGSGQWMRVKVASEAKYLSRPIVHEYREGKLKSTPEGGWKVHETYWLQTCMAWKVIFSNWRF